MTVLERFLRYVKVETTSCEENECCPSTPGQKILGAMLAEELREMGIHDTGTAMSMAQFLQKAGRKRLRSA